MDIALGHTCLEIESNLVLGEVDLVIEDRYLIDIETELVAVEVVAVEGVLVEVAAVEVVVVEVAAVEGVLVEMVAVEVAAVEVAAVEVAAVESELLAGKIGVVLGDLGVLTFPFSLY